MRYAKTQYNTYKLNQCKREFFFLKILWNKVGNFPTIFCLLDIGKPTWWFNFYKKNIKIYIKLTRVASYSSGQSLFLASRECQMPHNPTIPWAFQIYKASTSLFTVVGSQLLHNCLIITFSELTETKGVWEKFGGSTHNAGPVDKPVCHFKLIADFAAYAFVFSKSPL